jgi:hypothetical protein
MSGEIVTCSPVADGRLVVVMVVEATVRMLGAGRTGHASCFVEW